jgi:hypothetical protein
MRRVGLIATSKIQQQLCNPVPMALALCSHASAAAYLHASDRSHYCNVCVLQSEVKQLKKIGPKMTVVFARLKATDNPNPYVKHVDLCSLYVMYMYLYTCSAVQAKSR